MIKVTVRICGSEFYTFVKTPAEAYERVRSILNDKGDDSFEVLSNYMKKIIDLFSGRISEFEDDYMQVSEDMTLER